MLENKIKALESIADGLKDRLTEFIFVGGAVTELYSSKSLVDEYRPTTEVDCITQIHARSNLITGPNLWKRFGLHPRI